MAILRLHGNRPQENRDSDDRRLKAASARPVAPAAQRDQADRSLASEAALATLHRLIAGRELLVWMLVGTNFEPDKRSSGGGFAQLLAREIRRLPLRNIDVMIDCTRRVRTAALARVAPVWIDRCRPDIAIVVISPKESMAGAQGLSSFETGVAALIDRTRASGCEPVLCALPDASDHRGDVDAMVYREAIRAIAAEYEIPFVDCADDWGMTTSDRRPPGSADGPQSSDDPTVARVLRSLVEQLRLDRFRGSDRTDAVSSPG